MQQAALASSTYLEPPVVYVIIFLLFSRVYVYSSGRRRTPHVFSFPSRPSTANELARRVEALTVTAEQEVRNS
jgi:hypothetical protein